MLFVNYTALQSSKNVHDLSYRIFVGKSYIREGLGIFLFELFKIDLNNLVNKCLIFC